MLKVIPEERLVKTIIEQDTKLSIVSMADLVKSVQMRVQIIVYLILVVKILF